MSHIAYKRVSTIHQETNNQLVGMEFDKVFEEKISGKSVDNREQLKSLMEYARSGDIVYFEDFSRAGRNLRDLIEIIHKMTSKGVVLKFRKENLTFGDESNPFNNLLLGVLGSIAEYERTMIVQRIKIGVSRAHAEGKYKNSGRKPIFTAEQINELRMKHQQGIKISDLSKIYSTSRVTIYKYLKAN